VARGLLDTSVFIATESGRPIGNLPAEGAVSVVTIGELELGVLTAPEADTRVRRASTLALARAADPIPVTEATMSVFARLVHGCRAVGHRVSVLDAVIAATAIQHGLPVYTQDADFTVMAEAHPELDVRPV
jgi:predicted nucleic acid-binding protein